MNGIVPDRLKLAKIIPLFKKGDKHLSCNYRPISLLSIFDKIFEILIYGRLINFFKNMAYCISINLVLESITQHH